MLGFSLDEFTPDAPTCNSYFVARIAAALVSGGFLAGLYPVGEMKLYVSRGTATWGTSLVNALRIRLNTPPEITLIVLNRGV